MDASVVQRPHKVKLRRTLHNKAAVQENYYETDSGSDEDEEEEENEVEEVAEVKGEEEVEVRNTVDYWNYWIYGF